MNGIRFIDGLYNLAPRCSFDVSRPDDEVASAMHGVDLMLGRWRAGFGSDAEAICALGLNVLESGLYDEVRRGFELDDACPSRGQTYDEIMTRIRAFLALVRNSDEGSIARFIKPEDCPIARPQDVQEFPFDLLPQKTGPVSMRDFEHKLIRFELLLIKSGYHDFQYDILCEWYGDYFRRMSLAYMDTEFDSGKRKGSCDLTDSFEKIPSKDCIDYMRKRCLQFIANERDIKFKRPAEMFLGFLAQFDE